MAKNRTPVPDQEIKMLCKRIRETRKQWERINEEGGNDPFWPEGCGMNPEKTLDHLKETCVGLI